jgi:hypothetical protein
MEELSGCILIYVAWPFGLARRKNYTSFIFPFYLFLVTMDHLIGNWDMLTLGFEFVIYECLSMTIDMEMDWG